MVEGVNKNNSTAGLYAVGGAVVGGGAGATAAYLTKPYLKDGAPTDAFIKKMEDKITESCPNDVQENLKAEKNALNDALKEMKNAKTVEEFKNIYLDFSLKSITDEHIALLKTAVEGNEELYKKFGMDAGDPKAIEKLKNISSVAELREFASENFDKWNNGKTLEQMKKSFFDEAELYNKKAAQMLFEQYYDSTKKAFVDCEEGVGAAIKKAARSIQGKYAMIYGGIAAAVLAAGAYFAAMGGQKADEAAAEQRYNAEA